ncbi:MAG: hypothetical protein RKE49_07620 [Oceanicaulis sp.]
MMRSAILTVALLAASGAARADDVRVHQIMEGPEVNALAGSDCETIGGLPTGLDGAMPARLDAPAGLSAQYYGAGRLVYAFDTGNDGVVRNVRPIQIAYPTQSPVMTEGQIRLFLSAAGAQLGETRLISSGGDGTLTRRDCIAWADFVVN